MCPPPSDAGPAGESLPAVSAGEQLWSLVTGACGALPGTSGDSLQYLDTQEITLNTWSLR